MEFRAGIGDIDIFGELNNARYFNFMEIGRRDYSLRIGFVKIMPYFVYDSIQPDRSTKGP